MSPGEGASVRLAAAERYEREFVPSTFQDSAFRLADAAHVEPGHRVLDVGCGTGVVARECARRVGAAGSVTGLDVSEEMLIVARRLAPGIRWVQGDADSLPFEDGAFDRVLCQFALMFFPDPVRSVGQMWRVMAKGGRLAVSVSGRLEDSPVNLALAQLIRRRAGEAGLDIVNSVYVLGDTADIEQTFASGGVESVTIETEWGVTRSSSIAAFVETEIRGWAPLSELFDDQALEALIEDAQGELAFSVADDGRVEFSSPSHTVTAVKP